MGTSVPGNSCRNTLIAQANGPNCVVQLSDVCSTYTGPNIPAIGVNTGDNLQVVITKITNNLGGSGITQLTGDITTGTGGGIQTATLATVNSNVGSFGSSSNTTTFTVNGKGLITAAASTAIQIAENQVTNLVSDLASKQGTVTLTTNGTGGAATFITDILNIPNYTLTANNGLSIASSIVGLGQSIGASGNPASLLQDREIPFNGFGASFIDLLNTSSVQSKIAFFQSGDTPLDIQSNGDGFITPGSNAAYFLSLSPANYNHVYPSNYFPGNTAKMHRWQIGYAIQTSEDQDPTGMPDTVLNFGYNVTPEGGKVDNTDASWRFGFETHFIGGGNAPPNTAFPMFEIHMPEVTNLDGTLINRVNSYYIFKDTLKTDWISGISSHEYVLYNNPTIVFAAIETTNNTGGRLTLATDYNSSGLGDIFFVNALNGQHGSIGMGDTLFVVRFNNDSNKPFYATSDGRVLLNQNELGVLPFGQTLVGQSTGAFVDLEPSAQLQVSSLSRGFLPPKMTTSQKNAIVTPAKGLIVYDTDLDKLCVQGVAGWETITSA